jgi:hypothetical protein
LRNGILDYLDDDVAPARALLESMGSAPAGEIDAAQILRERPDVYAAFYSEFYGLLNDRNSHAWADRVGGTTPEDYARYWYRSYGEASGYVPGERAGVSAPAEDGPFGRTTVDGIPLAKILADRPDVFQAFFTEYYGPGNDRHSHAWVDRVGGATVEDYANYWYNAYGKVSGYTPSVPQGPSTPAEEPSVPGGSPGDVTTSGPPEVDPSLDPWNHPAIYPDWQPPYPGWQPPGPAGPPSDGASQPMDLPAEIALPLVVHETQDGGFELVTMSREDYVALQAQTLFDDEI